MTQDKKIKGLVLAGGQSRRMGRDKALLVREGKSQLQHAVELLQEFLPEVFVSTRADQDSDPERGRYQRIVDRYQNMGPLAGILSALECAPDFSWLVLACDLPNVDARTIETLLEQCSESQPFTAFASTYDGLPEPLCGIYAPEAGEILRRFADDGIFCPRKIMIRSDTCLLQQPDPAALDNINTPDDLAGSNLEAVS